MKSVVENQSGLSGEHHCGWGCPVGQMGRAVADHDAQHLDQNNKNEVQKTKGDAGCFLMHYKIWDHSDSVAKKPNGDICSLNIN